VLSSLDNIIIKYPRTKPSGGGAGDDTLSPSGIQNNAPESSFPEDVAKIGLIADTIYIPFRPSLGESERLPADLKFVEQVRTALPNVKVKNLLPFVDRVRWTKTAAEVEAMRSACGIVSEAFKEAARLTRPGLKESDIEAAVSYIFRRLGSERAAFLIIGSGPNSCILHHMKSNRQMEENEVLVIDIGNVYCSLSDDLTRTIPTSGKFTPEQKKITEGFPPIRSAWERGDRRSRPTGTKPTMSPSNRVRCSRSSRDLHS